MLFVVAGRLVDLGELAHTLRSRQADRLAFGATLLGTFVLHLDQAIYLGVGVSIVVFLWVERSIQVREMAIDEDGDVRETRLWDRPAWAATCTAIQLVNLDGPLFFGAASELQQILQAAERRGAEILILRVKRTSSLDITTAGVLTAAATHLHETGRALWLVGMVDEELDVLDRTGVTDVLGQDALYVMRPGHYTALGAAVGDALARVDAHGPHEGCGPDCPLRTWHTRHFRGGA